MSLVTKDTTKEVKYLNRDFDQIKSGLIEFTKRYYPNTYNDFNEASPGMMFIEMAAYVGDVLNYYIDSQLKESLLTKAQQKKNMLALAQAFGYKPKISVPALVNIDVYQYLPPSGSGENTVPDYDYALKYAPGLRVASNFNDTEFIIQDSVDFSVDDYLSPREVTVAEISTVDGSVQYYLAKKTYKAISGTVREKVITITDPVKYRKILIEDEDLVGISSIVDSDGNTWYEVPYLAQDTIFEKVTNTAFNDPDSYVNSVENPFLVKLLRVPRRFTTIVTERGIEIQFGAGVSTSPGEELLPTPENIGLSLPTGIENTDISFDTTSPIFTNAYGQAPSNTSLTIKYITGGGISSNVPSNTITNTVEAVLTSTLPSSNPGLSATIQNSFTVNNSEAAKGGRSEETIEEIRQNTLAQFYSQNRAVTREDYILRSYAMPSVFGSVSKAYITPDDQENLSTAIIGDRILNPLGMNMYVLGYDSDKYLTTVNPAVKENLRNYIGQYRMLTDSINIRDAFIVNIGVSLSVIPYPGYNGGEVIANCIQALKSFFNVDNWQINQPIAYSDIFGVIMKVKGVQMITSLQLENLNNEILGYSNVVYDIKSATKNGIVYPSYDPMIFEVKYLDNDIKVRIATY